MKISNIKAYEILDSRGVPTIETLVTLEDDAIGWAAVPSGASTGSYEAIELRDGDKNRYDGKGVLKAIENVETSIAKVVIGTDAANQAEIDQMMIDLDGTENKGNLGANAILSVSLAAARAEAQSEKKELYDYLSQFNKNKKQEYTLPLPMMNVLNGGKHGNWSTDIQEYMLFPISAQSISEAVRMNAETYMQLKSLLKEKGYSIAVGDEGGFAPGFSSNHEPFEVMLQAIEKAGYKPGKDIALGIDAAASEFYKENIYYLKREGKKLTTDELLGFYENLLSQYPIVSLEDIFAEDDWQGFEKFNAKHHEKYQLVGDDLYVTNVKRLQRGVKEKTSNSILIKLNQIGTLTETIAAIDLARENGMTAVVSHRSGETEDPFIADFVVAMGTGQIKTGAPCRSERNVKYNRLMKIEKGLVDKSHYAKFPFKI